MSRGGLIPETVTLRVVKREGRNELTLPEGAAQSRRTDNTLVKALACAFRWKQMLESGQFATIAELAEREGIAPSCMARVFRLTLLARTSSRRYWKASKCRAGRWLVCWRRFQLSGWISEPPSLNRRTQPKAAGLFRPTMHPPLLKAGA